MDTFLTKRDRRLLGWDEILQGGLAPGATVMSWRGIQHGITAAKAGHDVVMAPTSHTYFDYRQHRRKRRGSADSVIDLQKVYTFEPIPAELNADQAEHVLGGQAQLWGELIADAQRRDFMTWPRASALIETLWSPPGKRDVDLFLIRLAPHLERLKAAGINYRAPLDRKTDAMGRRDGRRGTALGPPFSSGSCPTTRIGLPSRLLRLKLVVTCSKSNLAATEL